MKYSGLELCDAECRIYFFFRSKYTGFNIGRHAGHLNGETRAIFSQMMLLEKA